ncbi:MAG TPA: hypothetical protein VMS55_03130 [Myxococcota bacterium]|nr:hypothetical protein [Myxococcota bacterium]
MHDDITPLLKAWESFYVIIGSTAGALTGLQFVVMTLIGEAGAGRKDSVAAFGSPNVVHFCAALLVAAILSAPWTAMWEAGEAVAACGVLGVVYSIVVTRRARRQQGYQPVLEDWIWHAILPAVAYATLFAAGVAIERSSAHAMFTIGAAVLLLVFVGIHNAWDTVTYMMERREPR